MTFAILVLQLIGGTTHDGRGCLPLGIIYAHMSASLLSGRLSMPPFEERLGDRGVVGAHFSTKAPDWALLLSDLGSSHATVTWTSMSHDKPLRERQVHQSKVYSSLYWWHSGFPSFMISPASPLLLGKAPISFEVFRFRFDVAHLFPCLFRYPGGCVHCSASPFFADGAPA